MIVNAIQKWAIIEIPRTGTKSLRDALMQIPGTFLYGNHNELFTLPPLFDGFDFATVVRDPVVRLHSLYRYLQMDEVVQRHPEWFAAIHNEVKEMTFAEWLVEGKAPFSGGGWPYTVGNPIPEQDKSQTSYFIHLDREIKMLKHEELFNRTDGTALYSLLNEVLRGTFVGFRHLNAARPDGHMKDPYALLDKKAATKMIWLDSFLYDDAYAVQHKRLQHIINS